MKLFSRFIHLFLISSMLCQSVYADNWIKTLFKAKSLSSCDIAFVSHLNGHIPANLLSAPEINMWDPRFSAKKFVEDLKTFPTLDEKLNVLRDLKRLVGKDQDFVTNYAEIGNELLRTRQVTTKQLDLIYLNNNPDLASFYYSKSSKRYIGKVEIDIDKEIMIDNFIKNQQVPESLKKEYKNIFLHSNRTAEEFEFAIENGLKLRGETKYLKQFSDYMEFIDPMNERQIKKAFKNVDQIYDLKYKHNPFTYAGSFLLNPKQKFLIQKSRIRAYEAKRARKWEKRALKGNDGKELSSSQKKNALKNARAESRIFSRLLNGCGGKGGKNLKTAAKKFSNFKFTLALIGTPSFYYAKNKDKLDKNSENYDQYWYERLGYEMGMSLIFTAVGNKLFTNTNSNFWARNLGGFWGKYTEGVLKFGAIDMVNAYGYDALFGTRGYATYIQKLYRKDVGDTPLEEEFKKLQKSPTFGKDLEELNQFLEKRSQDANLKNWLDKTFNLNTYKSGDDLTRITQEDLETEEGREVMMEILAEKMYAENMGSWEKFQSGNHGVDRWLFYRVRNSVWDIKGLILNLSIFQIMCREPLGKTGSWGLILAMVLGNELLSGDLTFEYRREAINQ